MAMSEDRDPGESPTVPAADDEIVPGVDRGDRVHTFDTPAVSVTWSRRRCIHAADCVMNLPTVFEPGRRPWVDPSQASPAAVARVVMRCPTGALHFERKDGGEPEPVPLVNTVLVSRNGPLMLRGDIEVLDETGEVRLRDTRVALCRCGLSRNKPLCDNAHREAGFREPGALAQTERVEDPGSIESRLRVTPRTNGSLMLEGPFAIRSADGQEMAGGTKTKLCRCGQSSAKPFCDGTHKRVGFRSE